MNTELNRKIDLFFRSQFGYSVFDSTVQVYLIGSFADDTYDTNSDIDLLITKFDSDDPPDPGILFTDAIEFDGVTRTVHISVNLIDGVTKSKPHKCL